MKNLLLYILVLFCVSCIDRQTNASSLLPELLLAEKLMFADTDSALHILQQMPVPDRRDHLQHATWALLLSEARYKSDITQSDSLIDLACSYFLSRDNYQRKALALYLKGCILNEHHREDEALPLLLQADEEVQFTDDYRLAHLNAAEIGILYSYRNLWDYAMKYLQKALDYAHQSGDNNYIASAYGYIARVYDANNEFDKAIIAYQNAIDKAPKGSYTRYRNLHEISRVYRDINNYELALYYEKQSYEIGKNKYNLDQVHLALGRLYDYLGQKDSAYYFLNIAKESSNIRTAKGAYSSLRELSQNGNDFVSADKYASIIFELQDSINTINRESKLIEMQEKYDQQKVINEKNQIKMQRDRILRYSLITILVLFIFISIIYLKNKNNKDIIRKNAILLIENESQLEKNKMQIAELQEQIKEGEDNEKLMLSIKALEIEEAKLKEENESLHFVMNNYKKTLSNKNSEIDRLYNIVGENEKRNNYIATLQDRLREQTPIIRKLKKKPVYIDEKQWKEVKELARLLFSGFEKLQDNRYNLSEADMELICLIKFDFTDEEIANMLAISTTSVYKRKQRLKEHLQKANIDIINIEHWIRTL